MIDSIIVSENLEDLYENAPCGYLSFLEGGRIIKINQTLLNWLSLDRSGVVSKLKFQDLISVGEQIFFETQVSPLLRVQHAVEEIQFNLKMKDGRRLPVLTSTKQVFLEAEKVAVNRMTLFNISDRKKFEAELKLERQKAEMAAKSKTDFLSMLSHEIRTPLNAIIGVSNLLESTKVTPEQAPFVEMLKNSSDNLMNLLNSILDLNKLDAGKVTLEKKEFLLRRLVSGLISSWQAIALKKGIELSAQVDDAVPDPVQGDPVKLTQILANLIGNAVKFTKHGFVRLSVRVISIENKTMVLQFEVQDTGIGIAPDKLALIFEEFTQAEGTTSEQFGGTGLGLAISQKLVRLYDSKIEVRSTPGEGSVFGFEVTLAKGDPNADTHGIERVANQLGALTGLNVLVADDSVDNLELMKHLLKKWGATVETARNGLEALDKVKRQNFDAVLMDLRMPMMNGYAAALAIRALSDKTKSRIPLIAFSGSATFDGHELIADTVFNSVVGKPFKPVDLIAKLLPYISKV